MKDQNISETTAHRNENNIYNNSRQIEHSSINAG